MQELNLLSTKLPSVLDIEGWSGALTKSSDATLSNGAWNFAGGSQVDYIRIPYQNTPYPLGENMEIRFSARINRQSDGVLALLCKWLQVAGNGEIAIQVLPDGTLINSIGSITEQGTQVTSAVITYGEDFEIYYRFLNNTVTMEFNGVECLNIPGTPSRSINSDWVIGSYLDPSGNPLQGNFVTDADWKMYNLKINRLPTPN